MHNPKKQAKLELLRDLRKMAMGAINEGIGEDMPGELKKVSVMAKDQEGLEEGLEKAQEIVEGDEMPEDEEESEDSPEALKAQIAELQAKLSKLNA